MRRKSAAIFCPIIHCLNFFPSLDIKSEIRLCKGFWTQSRIFQNTFKTQFFHILPRTLNILCNFKPASVLSKENLANILLSPDFIKTYYLTNKYISDLLLWLGINVWQHFNNRTLWQVLWTGPSEIFLLPCQLFLNQKSKN